MARIAILGATSHLAKDLIARLAPEPAVDAALFARRPEEMMRWATAAGFGGRFPAFGYGAFGGQAYDAILNFVGAGDPARVTQMGASIVEVTLRFDRLALDYLQRHPACRYLFLSSGAVYGGSFERPVDATAPCSLAIDGLSPQDHYAAAKLEAERRHRSSTGFPIIDIRVFNYFSRTQDLSARFFISDILRAIRERRALQTTDQPMVRDFLHPRDFRALIGCLLASPPVNAAVDCYTLAPVDKATLLATMQRKFGLDYIVTDRPATLDPSGAKPNYYSLNRKAAEFGYQSAYSSIECIVEEAAAII